MKLGFAILSHQVTGPLMEKLLSKLNEFPNKHIVIHHDFDQAPFNNDLKLNYNIELTDKYFKTEWSNKGIVLATFECLKKLVNTDWIILLSTSDYPIKKVETVLNFLSNTSYNAFIEGTAIIDNKNECELFNWVHDGVFKKTILKIPSFSSVGKFKWRSIRVNRKNPYLNNQVKLFFGSQWFMIDKKVADFLRNLDIENNKIIKFLSNSEVCKDETIIQTLVHNQSQFLISKKNYRYINWEKTNDWHPNTITTKHWKELKESDALFARKFNWNESQEVINLIDKEILI